MQYISIQKVKETLLLQPLTDLTVLYGPVKWDKTLASRFSASVFTRSLQYSPASQRHCAVCIPGTFRPYRNFASPIQPVRACTSIELSAFLSPVCSLSTCLPGGRSSGTTQLPPRSVPGRTTRSRFLWSSFHLSVQSASTLGFSRLSHCFVGHKL